MRILNIIGIICSLAVFGLSLVLCYYVYSSGFYNTGELRANSLQLVAVALFPSGLLTLVMYGIDFKTSGIIQSVALDDLNDLVDEHKMHAQAINIRAIKKLKKSKWFHGVILVLSLAPMTLVTIVSIMFLEIKEDFGIYSFIDVFGYVLGALVFLGGVIPWIYIFKIKQLAKKFAKEFSS